MHNAVKRYIEKVKERYPKHFENAEILEFGSMYFNGSPREFFRCCVYTGVDHNDGHCVDVVCKAHEFKSDKKFKTIITTEMLEHDKYAELSIKNALSLLEEDGILIITAAGVDREKHFDFVGEDDWYKNISKSDIEKWCKGYKIEIEDTKLDIRALIKK